MSKNMQLHEDGALRVFKIFNDVSFLGDDGDWVINGFQVDAMPASKTIEIEIGEVPETHRVTRIMVSPYFASLLFLEGKITKEDIEAADQTEVGVEFDDIEFMVNGYLTNLTIMVYRNVSGFQVIHVTDPGDDVP